MIAQVSPTGTTVSYHRGTVRLYLCRAIRSEIKRHPKMTAEDVIETALKALQFERKLLKARK